MSTNNYTDFLASCALESLIELEIRKTNKIKTVTKRIQAMELAPTLTLSFFIQKL